MLELKAEDYRGIGEVERSTRVTGKKPYLLFNADWNKCELQHRRKLT